MASSGSVDFAITRSDIIGRALRIVNAVGQGQAIPAEESSSAAMALNSMIKEWANSGIHVWKTEEAILFLSKSTQSYQLGPTGDRATLISDYVATTLSAAEASGQTVLSVTSSTGMTAADVVGITLDADTIDWTTIVSVDSATQITVTDALTGDAASGNRVHTYTSILQRPLRVMNLRRSDESAALETPFAKELSREEYMALPNKANQGKPTEAYYDPMLTNGRIYIWPTADTTDDTIRFTAHLPIEDMDAAANNPDFPQEWYNALSWGLAEQLIPEHGVPDPRAGRIERMAARSLAMLEDADSETASVQFEPDMGP